MFQLGIITDGTYAITGAKLNEMSDEEFEKEFKNKNAGIIKVLEKNSAALLKISVNEISFIFIFSVLISNPDAKTRIKTAETIIKRAIKEERAIVSIPLHAAYKETAHTDKAIKVTFISGEMTFEIKTRNKDKL